MIVVVALARLGLYEDAFGLTMLRLYSKVFAVWIGVVFVLLAVDLAGVGRRRAWLPSAAVAAGLVALFALNVVNPEAMVVRHNVDFAERSGRFDPVYLTELSDDAVPALVDALPRLDPEARGRRARPGLRDGLGRPGDPLVVVVQRRPRRRRRGPQLGVRRPCALMTDRRHPRRPSLTTDPLVRWTKAGPRTTMNTTGRMQNTSGKMTFTGQLHGPLLGPEAPLLPLLDGLGPQHPGDGHAVGLGLHDGVHELTELGHVGPAPGAGPRASARGTPTRRSCSRRADLRRTSGPWPDREMRARAASKPSPASTQIVSWSSVSGSSLLIASWRVAARRASTVSGPR